MPHKLPHKTKLALMLRSETNLSAGEQALILSALKAVNSSNSSLVPTERRPLAEIDGDAALGTEFYPEEAEEFRKLEQEDFAELRAALLTLARGERLPEDQLEQFAGMVKGGCSVDLDVQINRGRVEFTHSIRFREGSEHAAVALVVLRLAELSAERPALLICDRCGAIALVEPTGGRHSTRFCSKRCRNNYDQSLHRLKEHPCYTAREYERLTKKGRSHREIREIWNRRLSTSRKHQ